jgi:hypothetical protein
MKFRSIILILLVFVLFSCEDAGTMLKVDRGNHENIEVYKYYYDKGEYVYVARFKDQPEIVTSTWSKQKGKTRVKRGNVTIFENDSIKVILK